MMNFEKCKEEVREIASQGNNLAKVNGVLKPCNDISECEDCDFNGDVSCGGKVFLWLLSDDGTPSAERAAGRKEAWELIRRLLSYVEDGGLSPDELREIFATTIVENIVKYNTYAQAAEKVKAWEDGKRIKRGDVVRTKTDPDDCGDMVVLGDYNGFEKNIRVMYGDFCTRVFSESDLIKTGRTLPVEDWLRQIGGKE